MKKRVKATENALSLYLYESSGGGGGIIGSRKYGYKNKQVGCYKGFILVAWGVDCISKAGSWCAPQSCPAGTTKE